MHIYRAFSANLDMNALGKDQALEPSVKAMKNTEGSYAFIPALRLFGEIPLIPVTPVDFPS